jgi:aspartate/methionine/tyrosine aminotransferase
MSIRPSLRVQSLERTLIRQIFDSAPADAINLGLGQPDLPTPGCVALAGVAAVTAGRTRYTTTAGDPALRQAIAESYGSFASGPASVLITIGSQEAMFAACLGLVDPGDEILYPDPGYPAYPAVARLVGASPVAYALRAEDGFRARAEEIARVLSERTRLVILCAPSNPTGACHDAQELQRILALLSRHGVSWLSDEVYAGLRYDEHPCSPAPWSADGVVISGLSKEMCMTGWRLGWVVGPEALVARLVAAHQYLVTCASSISQAAALAAFTPAGRIAREAIRERFRQRRALMARELGHIPGIRFEPPQGAFYFFVDVSRYGSSLAIAQRLLERRKVVTIPGQAFGANGEGYLRISFAASEADIERGVRALGAELAGG